MVWQELNMQWEEEDSVEKADAVERSGARALNKDRTQEAPGIGL